MKKEIYKGSAIIGEKEIKQEKTAQSGKIDLPNERRLHKIISADRHMVGTLPVLRAFAADHNDFVSPFVFLDEFGPVEVQPGRAPLRVDAHPHAGVIPTTYFLQGSGHHKDSLNYDFEISKGDFMMFSSGRGAIHMEESGADLFNNGGLYHGFQIWLNMPAKYKHIDPSTAVYNSEMPLIENDQFEIRVLIGNWGNEKSTAMVLQETFYYHIKLKANAKIEIPVHEHHNAFIYNISGELELVEQSILKAHQLALYERNATLISVYTKEGAEFLCMGGMPLNEVVYAYGPFVMNNEEQIRNCIRAYQIGAMGDPMRVNA